MWRAKVCFKRINFLAPGDKYHLTVFELENNVTDVLWNVFLVTVGDEFDTYVKPLFP